MIFLEMFIASKVGHSGFVDNNPFRSPLFSINNIVFVDINLI